MMGELQNSLASYFKTYCSMSLDDLERLVRGFLGDEGLEHNINFLIDVGTICEIRIGQDYRAFCSGTERVEIRKSTCFLGG